ncbi:MAG: cellulase family glycosylhydrolase [Elusimicrobiota bacterium]
MKTKIIIYLLFLLIMFNGIYTANAGGAERMTKDSLKTKGFLKASGRQIVDGKGNAVILRGINLANWMVPEGYIFEFEGKFNSPTRIYGLTKTLVGEEESAKFWTEFRERFITESDIRAIAGYGFNSVRVPFHYSFFAGGKDGTEGFGLIDDLVRWCKKYGVYVILDMHCAPGGQTGSNIDDSVEEKPGMWPDEAKKQETVRIWGSIAEHYKDCEIIAGYDLLNEPVSKNADQYVGDLLPMYKALVAAVRSVDGNHILFIEGAKWATNFSMFDTPIDDNMVYSFHKYWNETDADSISKYLELSEAQNVPLWCGETGENDNQWYYSCTELLEANGISWCFWPWKKLEKANCPCSIKMPEGFDKIIEYTKGEEVPGKEESMKALKGFLESIRYEKCAKNGEVVSSLMKTIPAVIEAEDFGHGGEGVSYHDSDKENKGEKYRPLEGVDIQQVGYSVGWISDGEWLEYEVNSPSRKAYDVEFRVASPNSSGKFRLEIEGKDVSGLISAANTGVWSTWTTIVKKGVVIPKGRHKIRFYVISGEFNIDWIKFK